MIYFNGVKAIPTRKIIVEVYANGQLDVCEHGKCFNGLTWDEMLGCVARLTHPEIKEEKFLMLTDKEWNERRIKMKKQKNQ